LQYGFVIDQSRCIGCHACTVACKQENSVPVGSFRTWVKYTEAGAFPAVKRSFTVLRCNQCTAAPCVTICPVNALEKRSDGIVDIDPRACIGCKSCLQGCPYDALYLNESSGTVEKCHFCAHRVEQGLAPACTVVCPTEALIPGDFDDPGSLVSRIRREQEVSVRKPEAGTAPNVVYVDVAPAGIDPLRTNGAGGMIWADRRPTPQLEAAEFEAAELAAMERRAEARTTYDVAHPPLWGAKITGYLFAKSLAAGVFVVGGVAGLAPVGSAAGARPGAAWMPLLALGFLALTSALLVLDLKRPERFWYLLARPNWSSWLVRGTYALIAYGGLLGAWLAIAALGLAPPAALGRMLWIATVPAAGLAACYTAWLFGQAKGRVLWMRRGLWFELLVHAGLAGAGFWLVAGPLLGVDEAAQLVVRRSALGLVLVQLVLLLVEGRLAPPRRAAEYARVHALVTRGPYAARHRAFVLGLGTLLPIVLLLAPVFPFSSLLVGAALLVGLWVGQDVLVRAGQALSIS